MSGARKRKDRKMPVALRATFPAIVHQATIEAYSNKTDALVYTLHLPTTQRSWLRKLLRTSPRQPIHGGMWPLDSKQVSAIQKLVELQLDDRAFGYYLDGCSTIQTRPVLKRAAHRRMTK